MRALCAVFFHFVSAEVSSPLCALSCRPPSNFVTRMQTLSVSKCFHWTANSCIRRRTSIHLAASLAHELHIREQHCPSTTVYITWHNAAICNHYYLPDTTSEATWDHWRDKRHRVWLVFAPPAAAPTAPAPPSTVRSITLFLSPVIKFWFLCSSKSND